MLRPLDLGRRTRYSWNRRLSGLKKWSGDFGEEIKSLVPAENRTRDCPARSLLILEATVTLFAH
jgi:hypothetical protein